MQSVHRTNLEAKRIAVIPRLHPVDKNIKAAISTINADVDHFALDSDASPAPLRRKSMKCRKVVFERTNSRGILLPQR